MPEIKNKWIIITDKGFIPALADIKGPIDKPILTSLIKIRALITSNATVYEVDNLGNKYRLNLNNYNVRNHRNPYNPNKGTIAPVQATPVKSDVDVKELEYQLDNSLLQPREKEPINLKPETKVEQPVAQLHGIFDDPVSSEPVNLTPNENSVSVAHNPNTVQVNKPHINRPHKNHKNSHHKEEKTDVLPAIEVIKP